jgi:hypothetical protein
VGDTFLGEWWLFIDYGVLLLRSLARNVAGILGVVLHDSIGHETSYSLNRLQHLPIGLIRFRESW